MRVNVISARRSYIVLIIVAVTFISGCFFTQFKEPLPQVDPSEIVDCSGVWVHNKNGSFTKLIFRPHKEKGWLKEKPTGWYDFSFTNKEHPSKEDAKKKPVQVMCFATKIGRETFLCFPVASMRKEDGKHIAPKEDERSGKLGYLYAWYELKGDKLRFDFFKSDKIKELVNNGMLGKKVTKSGTRLDCSAKEVVALLKSHGVELFIGEERGREFVRLKK